jgi:formate-dependent nitrite reductase membrane component NrfD
MHKTFFLSKEVSGVYDFCWHLLNDHIFHDHLFFHDTFLLPLAFINSWLDFVVDLSSPTLEHLSEFSPSLASCCLLFISTLLFSGLLQFLLMFHALLFTSIHWTLSLHYQLWYFGIWPLFHGCEILHLLPSLKFSF